MALAENCGFCVAVHRKPYDGCNYKFLCDTKTWQQSPYPYLCMVHETTSDLPQSQLPSELRAQPTDSPPKPLDINTAQELRSSSENASRPIKWSVGIFQGAYRTLRASHRKWAWPQHLRFRNPLPECLATPLLGTIFLILQLTLPSPQCMSHELTKLCSQSVPACLNFYFAPITCCLAHTTKGVYREEGMQLALFSESSNFVLIYFQNCPHKNAHT